MGQRTPKRELWHLGGELLAYGLALVLPKLLQPLIYGTVFTEVLRTIAMAAVCLTLIATGVMMRIRWPKSWIPSAILSGFLAVVMSPWHTITVGVACLSLLVFFATQVWPDLQDMRPKNTHSPLLGVGTFALGAAVIAYALLRMAVISGFPVSLAQALKNQRVTILYLHDNRSALREQAPAGLPWALYAAKYADAQSLEAILSKGASLFDYDRSTMGSPLQWLAANIDSGDKQASEKARIMARYGAPVDGAVIAAHRGMTELTRTLVALGDKVNQQGPDGIAPLASLIEANATRLVDNLLTAGATVGSMNLARSRSVTIKIPSEEMWVVLNNHGIVSSPIFTRSGGL